MSRYRPGQALGFPGGSGSRLSRHTLRMLSGSVVEPLRHEILRMRVRICLIANRDHLLSLNSRVPRLVDGRSIPNHFQFVTDELSGDRHYMFCETYQMDDTETIIISKSGQRNKLRLLHVRRDELAQRFCSCLRTAVGSTSGSSHVYARPGCALVWWLGCQLGGRDSISSWRGDFSFSFTIVSRSVLGLSPSILSGTKEKQPQHEKDHQPPLVPRLSTHAAVPTLLRLTFRISIGLTSDGIKFAVKVG